MTAYLLNSSGRLSLEFGSVVEAGGIMFAGELIFAGEVIGQVLNFGGCWF